MKIARLQRSVLDEAGRWDIDFHLPAEGIREFAFDGLRRVDAVADIATEKRDPTQNPEASFQYVDIASVDVATGAIVTPQELEGEEAPSRARKVISAFDVIVSTCRPTRGAIAVVPQELHNEIASTAFTVLRPHTEVNPYYLYFALRLPSTLEQFRKWSTGSSYPAILDDDVRKTLIPWVSVDAQNAVAAEVMRAFAERAEAIRQANERWDQTLAGIRGEIARQEVRVGDDRKGHSLAEVAEIRAGLAPLTFDAPQRRGRGRGT